MTPDEAKGAILSAVDEYGEAVKAPLEDKIIEQGQQLVALQEMVNERDLKVAGLTERVAGMTITIQDQMSRITWLEAENARLQSMLDAVSPRKVDSLGVVAPWQLPDYKAMPLLAYFNMLSELGVKTIRGRWETGGRGDQVMDLCAQFGIKWLVTLIPESWGESGAKSIILLSATLKARLDAMFANPAAVDVVIGVEGMNEPNQGRSGAVILADWPQRCAAFNKTIADWRQTNGGSWVILSSAMHDEEDDKHNGGDWVKLAAAYAEAGTMPDIISVHSYPKGQQADNLLDERLARVNAAFPQIMPVWVTEFGWFMTQGGGPAYTPPETAAEYMRTAPDLLIGANGGQVERAFYYELTDPDRGLYWNGVMTAPGIALKEMNS